MRKMTLHKTSKRFSKNIRINALTYMSVYTCVCFCKCVEELDKTNSCDLKCVAH